MKKNYNYEHQIDLEELIPIRETIDNDVIKFVRGYFDKLGIDIEEDELIVMTTMDGGTLGHFIVDIIMDYDRTLKKL